jgi:hypothetical protein
MRLDAAGKREMAPMRWGFARCNRLLAARAPVVHGDRVTAEQLRRNKFEPSRAGQPALVQSWAVAGAQALQK